MVFHNEFQSFGVLNASLHTVSQCRLSASWRSWSGVQCHKQHQVHNMTHYTLSSSGSTHSENIQPVLCQGLIHTNSFWTLLSVTDSTVLWCLSQHLMFMHKNWSQVHKILQDTETLKSNVQNLNSPVSIFHLWDSSIQ